MHNGLHVGRLFWRFTGLNKAQRNESVQFKAAVQQLSSHLGLRTWIWCGKQALTDTATYTTLVMSSLVTLILTWRCLGVSRIPQTEI